MGYNIGTEMRKEALEKLIEATEAGVISWTRYKPTKEESKKGIQPHYRSINSVGDVLRVSEYHPCSVGYPNGVFNVNLSDTDLLPLSKKLLSLMPKPSPISITSLPDMIDKFVNNVKCNN